MLKIANYKFSFISNKKVIWKCRHGHEWEASIKSRIINGTGCLYCSHNRVLEGFNDLASQMPEIADEWSEKNYPLLPTMVTPYANRKVWWKCSKGHKWHTLISTRSGGSKCPYCSGIILLRGFNNFATKQKEDGRYELVSGHRRKKACELAGFETLRCEVVDLTRDESTILMVESNFQRSQILPSEKAFPYKMWLEAMNRQGKRSDLTSASVGQKFSRELSL